MNFIEIFLIAFSLSMDAFAVSICQGLSMKNISNKDTITTGIYFGLFQMIMPALGYFLGFYFSSMLDKIDHWIAFILLASIAISMIHESFEDKSNKEMNYGFKNMIILAIATSIDALAIGVTFAFLKVNLLLAVLTIGIVCFLISISGVKIGNRFGSRFGNKTGLFGGIILFFIGVKILLEHLGLF